MRQCVLLLVLSIPAAGQSIRFFTVGDLQCGLVKRAPDQVQLYCYGPGRVLRHNSISTVYPITDVSAALEIRYEYGLDRVKVLLNLVAGGIWYEVISTAQGFVGTLVDVFGAVGLGCGLPVDSPRYQWTVGAKSCTGAWRDEWLNCCVG